MRRRQKGLRRRARRHPTRGGVRTAGSLLDAHQSALGDPETSRDLLAWLNSKARASGVESGEARTVQGPDTSPSIGTACDSRPVTTSRKRTGPPLPPKGPAPVPWQPAPRSTPPAGRHGTVRSDRNGHPAADRREKRAVSREPRPAARAARVGVEGAEGAGAVFRSPASAASAVGGSMRAGRPTREKDRTRRRHP